MRTLHCLEMSGSDYQRRSNISQKNRILILKILVPKSLLKFYDKYTSWYTPHVWHARPIYNKSLQFKSITFLKNPTNCGTTMHEFKTLEEKWCSGKQRQMKHYNL